MATRTCCLLLLCCSVATALAASSLLYRSPERENPTLPDFTEACLGCICDATSACNLTIGCSAGLCGPFLIGRQYWVDAGAPVLAGDSWHRRGAYESCAVDPYCATSTIYNYMSRYAQDCNGDQVVTCDDYARIHYLGGLQCQLAIHNYAYYRVFRQCMSKILPQQL
ncbi:lysozyme-like [Lycorma delicatula]|uniref:lysozyme-like n=1 Tax=Lycorma delicatula TaxID=130591 RepID=UPI003F5172C3